jgi:hypothetical protein
MFSRRLAAASTVVVMLLAAVPAWALHKPPTTLTFSVIRRSSNVMYSGSCTARHASDPPPAVTSGLAVWDAETIVTVPVRLTLRPVLEDGSPTGEFIFSGAVAAAALDAPLAGRLLVDAQDCELLTLGALVLDSSGQVPPYAVHTDR